MKQVKLTLDELLGLEYEIAGFQVEGQVIVKGLLSQEISFPIKYHLNKLLKIVEEEKKTINSLKDEIIKKYGEEDKDGSVTIPKTIKVKGKEVENEKYYTADKEIKELLLIEKEVEVHAFKPEDFLELKTTEVYRIFFKLLD